MQPWWPGSWHEYDSCWQPDCLTMIVESSSRKRLAAHGMVLETFIEPFASHIKSGVPLVSEFVQCLVGLEGSERFCGRLARFSGPLVYAGP